MLMQPRPSAPTSGPCVPRVRVSRVIGVSSTWRRAAGEAASVAGDLELDRGERVFEAGQAGTERVAVLLEDGASRGLGVRTLGAQGEVLLDPADRQVGRAKPGDEDAAGDVGIG